MSDGHSPPPSNTLFSCDLKFFRPVSKQIIKAFNFPAVPSFLSDEIDDENGRLFGSLHDEKFGKLHDHSRFQSNLQGRRLGSVRKPVRRTRSANLANTYSTHCHGSFELDDKGRLMCSSFPG